MSLPELLKQAIERESSQLDLSELKRGREELTHSYRHQKGKPGQHMSSGIHKLAYIIYRMPATYAVNEHVLNEIQAALCDVPLESLLDLGSGPGTAMWAVQTVFPTISKYTLVEKDSDLIAISKKLATTTTLKIRWKQQDIATAADFFEEHDLVTLSYVINELPLEQALALVQKAWMATTQALVVIEPGTPEGFERIKLVRQKLIELGGHPIAPCPHADTCPMAQNDWCHFSQRLERTRTHKQMKQGSLGYEDEKYSYIAMSKHPVSLPEGRILRHPLVHTGHRIFEVCTKHDGLQRMTLSKKDGDLYKKAKKWEWGDPFLK